jgi:hypothetical protein
MILRAVSAFALIALASCGQAPADKAASAEAPPAAPAAPIEQPPPPPADPLAVGSQDAKDDLYCAGIVFASNPSPDGALNPTDEAVLRRQQAWGIILAESGINKLVEQKAVHATHGALIADAYTDQAAKDLAAKKPRIELEKCYDRAKAMPVVQ